MRVMVLAKATEGMALGEPTPEALEAFAAMDRFTEELVRPASSWPPPASRTTPRASASSPMAPAARSSMGRSPRAAS